MSSTKQKIFVVIVLVLVVLFGVGQFFAGAGLNTANQQAAQNTNTPPATQVVKYIPDASIIAGTTPVQEGSCFANSVAAPYRTDAWRCTVGNAISDPCFQIPDPNPNATTTPPYLFCSPNPSGTNTSSTFVLQLTKALPKPEKTSSTAPASAPTNWAWLVQLNDGTVCSPFTGTRPFDASGDVATYACNGAATNESMIFGDLNNASATWTAEVGSLSTATTTFPPILAASATVPVFAVWQ